MKSIQPHISFRNIQRGRCRRWSSHLSPHTVHRADRVHYHKDWGHFDNAPQRNQEDTHIWIPTPGPSRKEAENSLKQDKARGEHNHCSPLPHIGRCSDTDPDSCCFLHNTESELLYETTRKGNGERQ